MSEPQPPTPRPLQLPDERHPLIVRTTRPWIAIAMLVALSITLGLHFLAAAKGTELPDWVWPTLSTALASLVPVLAGPRNRREPH